jgi:hypothetical protein
MSWVICTSYGVAETRIYLSIRRNYEGETHWSAHYRNALKFNSFFKALWCAMKHKGWPRRGPPLSDVVSL